MFECLVCDDCALWWVNADLSHIDDEDRANEIRSVDGYFIVDCGEDQQFCHDFSSARCDACGTRLAGSRHRAWFDDRP